MEKLWDLCEDYQDLSSPYELQLELAIVDSINDMNRSQDVPLSLESPSGLPPLPHVPQAPVAYPSNDAWYSYAASASDCNPTDIYEPSYPYMHQQSLSYPQTIPHSSQSTTIDTRSFVDPSVSFATVSPQPEPYEKSRQKRETPTEPTAHNFKSFGNEPNGAVQQKVETERSLKGIQNALNELRDISILQQNAYTSIKANDRSRENDTQEASNYSSMGARPKTSRNSNAARNVIPASKEFRASDGEMSVAAIQSLSTKQNANPSQAKMNRSVQEALDELGAYSQGQGTAIIINNKTFTNAAYRTGTDKDEKDLTDLFNDLNIISTCRQNLTKIEMLEALKNFSKSPMQDDSKLCFIVMLSHGNNIGVIGTDGEPLDLEEEVFPLFSTMNCPILSEVPKLFIIPSCRGGRVDFGVDCYDDGSDPTSSEKVPLYQHIAIMYGCVDGYKSFRNQKTGTWLVQTFIDVVRQYGQNIDFSILWKLIEKRMMRRKSSRNSRTTPELSSRGLYKLLYLRVQNKTEVVEE